MFNTQYGNTGTNMVGGPASLENMPGMQLTAEQEEVCRKDREKLASLLLKVMGMQGAAIVANVAVGGAGIAFYDAGEGPPFSVGLFICAAVFSVSILGAYNLRQKALNFSKDDKSVACCWLMLFQIPIMFSITGVLMTIIFATTSNTFSSKCEDTGSSFQSSFTCTSNPTADEYRTVGIIAMIVIVFNIATAIMCIAVLCTSPKAFATNQVTFQRPAVQTRANRNQTMMMQQQLILQQQMQMQSQMQTQQMQAQQNPVYPPPMGAPPPPMYNSMY